MQQDNIINVTSRLTIGKSAFLLLFIALIFSTFLRAVLLLIAPLVVLLLIDQLRLTFRFSIVFLFGVLFVSYVISLFDGFFIRYNLLSFFYILPFLLLLFSIPRRNHTHQDLLHQFMLMLAAFAVFNDLLGFIQYAIAPNDDNFMGTYGHFTVTQNGLSLINSILFVYFIKYYRVHKRVLFLILAIFFIISFVMGFYGAGLIVFVAAFFLHSFKFSLSKLIRIVLISFIVLSGLYVTMKLVSPNTLQYNINIINRFLGNNKAVPRKLLSYSNYVEGYTANPRDLLFGSGPGTFNSRSAFVIGSPDYFNIASFLKSPQRPYYFENYAYTLWNASNTRQYEDGFMNQPFSSMLAFLGEYGLIFTFFFLLLYRRQYNRISKAYAIRPDDLIAKEMFKFISIFLLLLLVIDNYAEYPEISILLILIMKLAEKRLMVANVNYEGKA